VPLIIDLHGGGGSAAGQAAYSEWAGVADSQGAVVVWADGIDGMWNSEGSAATADSKFNQDDVGFLRSAIATILAAHPTVDSTRIYMTGYSLGCYMSHGFAVEASGLVAAVACSAGALAIPTAPSGYQPTSVMHVHGTQDATIPYSTATVEAFAEFNGCGRSPVVSSHTGYNRHQYSNCNGGNVEVALIELLGVDHSLQTAVPFVQISWDFLSRFTTNGGGVTATGAAAAAIDEDDEDDGNDDDDAEVVAATCVDDASFRLGKSGRNARRGCAWIAASTKTARKCRRTQVRAGCPYTCGQC
jgi:poly(3-hydroxybutyrate) depolymerase